MGTTKGEDAVDGEKEKVEPLNQLQIKSIKKHFASINCVIQNGR